MNALLVALLLTAPDAGVDPVFQALDAELARAKTLSLLESPQASKPTSPYHLLAFVGETTTFSVNASFGALTGRGQDTSLMVNTHVRVGSPQLDNTNFLDSSGFPGRRSTPAELEPLVLRQALWLAFDFQFKEALETLARKKAFLESNAVRDRLPDLSPAKLATVLEPRAELKVDREKLVSVVKNASKVFLDYPMVSDGWARANSVAWTQWMVSSDPARHRFAELRSEVMLGVSTQASDGMSLRLNHRFGGNGPEDLPTEAEVVAKAKQLAERLTELAKQPIAEEDYAGPVLFVGQAADMFFLQTVAEPLSEPREPLGSRQEGRLVDRLGKRIAVKQLSVKDDPTLKRFTAGGKDQALWGYYPVDDDGVAPQQVTLVDQGTLRGYYMNRAPTKLLTQSNGHARGNRPAAGSVFVSTSEPVSAAELEKKLVELLKEEDLEYGLVVEQTEEYPGRASGNEGTPLSAPMLVWKVYPNGKRVPVRGLSFKPVSSRVLRELVAMGDEPHVLNLEVRRQRTSVVAPSVLVRFMELTRSKRDFEKPPALARPK